MFLKLPPREITVITYQLTLPGEGRPRLSVRQVVMGGISLVKSINLRPLVDCVRGGGRSVLAAVRVTHSDPALEGRLFGLSQNNN